MGMYDTVGKNRMQVKINADGKHYRVGDKTNLEDGMYLTYEGWFVVEHNTIFCEGKKIFTKWGDNIYGSDVLYYHNPGIKVMDNKEKEIK